MNLNLTKLQNPKINCNLRFRSRLVELLFDYKIKGSLKHFADAMYSITEFNAFLLMDRRFWLTIITFCDCLSFLKFEQWRR